MVRVVLLLLGVTAAQEPGFQPINGQTTPGFQPINGRTTLVTFDGIFPDLVAARMLHATVRRGEGLQNVGTSYTEHLVKKLEIEATIDPCQEAPELYIKVVYSKQDGSKADQPRSYGPFQYTPEEGVCNDGGYLVNVMIPNTIDLSEQDPDKDAEPYEDASVVTSLAVSVPPWQ